MDTYYVVAQEDDGLPAQYEWYTESQLDTAKEDVVEFSENDNVVHAVYEITVRKIYRTNIAIELETL